MFGLPLFWNRSGPIEIAAAVLSWDFSRTSGIKWPTSLLQRSLLYNVHFCSTSNDTYCFYSTTAYLLVEGQQQLLHVAMPMPSQPLASFRHGIGSLWMKLHGEIPLITAAKNWVRTDAFWSLFVVRWSMKNRSPNHSVVLHYKLSTNVIISQEPSDPPEYASFLCTLAHLVMQLCCCAEVVRNIKAAQPSSESTCNCCAARSRASNQQFG